MIGRPHPELVEGEAASYTLNDLAFDGPEESRIIAALTRERWIARPFVGEVRGQISAVIDDNCERDTRDREAVLNKLRSAFLAQHGPAGLRT